MRSCSKGRFAVFAFLISGFWMEVSEADSHAASRDSSCDAENEFLLMLAGWMILPAVTM